MGHALISCRESCLQQLPWHICWLHYPGSPLVLMGNNDSTELSLNCCWNVSCMHGHVLLLTLRGRLVLDAKLLNTKTPFIIGLQKQNPANSNELSPVRTKAKQLPTYIQMGSDTLLTVIYNQYQCSRYFNSDQLWRIKVYTVPRDNCQGSFAL